MKIFSLFMAVLVSASMAFSQTSIQGTVTDAETGEPIIFATVALYKNGVLQTGTETDLDGFYSITEIDPGKYEVEFSYTGYASQKLTGVTVSAGKANAVDMKMTAGIDLAEIVIVYEAPIIQTDVCGSGIILKEEVKNLPTRNINGIKANIPQCFSERTPPRCRKNSTEYNIEEIKVSGSILPKQEKKPLSTEKMPKDNTPSPHTLTAGEINDFNEWKLWQDIADIDLEKWKNHWQIHPTERYTIQAMTENGQPIVDAEVKLFSEKKETIWTARTDNTGRAELWANPFSENIETGKLSAEINYEGQTEKLKTVTEFKNGINTVTFETPCEQPDGIDLLFVVDGTGSMGDEINFLKAELTDVIEKAKDGLPDLNLNLGSIFYRDVRDEYLTRQSPFSENISQTVDFIKKQKAGGGGDKPEAVEIALAEAIHDMPWSESARARLLFLVMDAPPHTTPDIIEELKTLSQEAAAKGIRIIPVAGSGTDKSTEYLTRSLALLTNGTYTFLTDDSGIGGSHIEPTSDVYNVENLNELLVRIILQYSEMPDCEESVVIREPNFFNDKKVEKKLGLKIFPNPSSGPLTIQLKSDVDELYVTDLSGKILFRYENLKKGKTPINLTKLPNGSYMIRAIAHGHTITERVVILH